MKAKSKGVFAVNPIHKNPPAFPTEYTHGMSLRDWFAGQALAGMSSNMPQNKAAIWCYEMADEMLKCRQEKQDGAEA